MFVFVFDSVFVFVFVFVFETLFGDGGRRNRWWGGYFLESRIPAVDNNSWPSRYQILSSLYQIFDANMERANV